MENNIYDCRKLKKILIANDLTVADFAIRIGQSSANVYDLMRKQPTQRTLKVWASALQMSVSELDKLLRSETNLVLSNQIKEPAADYGPKHKTEIELRIEVLELKMEVVFRELKKTWKEQS